MAVDNATIQSVLDYFGSGSSIYRKIVLGQATDSEISYAFTQIPQMKVDYSSSGSVLGYSYADPVYIVPSNANDIATSVNSNAGGGGYSGGVSANYPISFGRDEQGRAYIDAGKNVTGSAIKAVVDRVSLGVTGVNIGAKLGKAIDQTLYDLSPEWWDEHYPTINPDTWVTLAGENELGKKFIRTIFGIDDSGGVTAYVDEKILAQTYQLLRDLGVYGDSEYTIQNTSILKYPNNYQLPLSGGGAMKLNYNSPTGYQRLVTFNGIALSNNYKEGSLSRVDIYSLSPITISTGETNVIYTGYTLLSNSPYTLYYQGFGNQYITVLSGSVNRVSTSVGVEQDIATILIDGTSQSAVQGFRDFGTQYLPTNITGTTLDDVLSELKQQYPELFDGSITENVVQPDGTINTKTYIPIPWQVSDSQTNNETSDKTISNPITKADPTQQTKINPEIAPKIITQTKPSSLDDTPTIPPTDTPNTGTGDTPPSILPIGQASHLWAIYNPSQSQIDDFGAWLWSSNFVEQLKKLFNDPMQAIIGIHKVFATPITGGSQNIVCGYLDSGVSSKVVTSQYSAVECGSVDLTEYYGNVFDYPPYTDVKLYLPFIGIVPLNVDYIMRSTITITYKVDVLTGACLVNVSVSRDGAGGVLFTYGGSAIVSYPVSSGSYTGIIAGALSLATGVVGTIASGGAALPAVMGAVAGIGKAHTDIQHSGQFSGAAGAMGIKIPYLIISRPQTRIANNVANFAGKPTNATMTLGECSGFVRVSDVHLSISNAFVSELNDIERLLKQGVII